jgi:hypothetical protein
MRLRWCLLLALLALGLVGIGEVFRPTAPESPRGAERLTGVQPPEVILDGSEHGSRLIPHFADFDGDGKTDLLVGVGDRLLVYRNRGTNARPEYAEPAWFDETEPSARIPYG